MFGDISSLIAVAGHIYVADVQGSTVRAYDMAGRFAGQVGGKGRGPGEFNRPLDLALDTAGHLYVRDISRIAVFAASSPVGIRDSLVRTIAYAGAGESTRSKTNGALYYSPGGHFGDPNRFFYRIVDRTGPTGDTVDVPHMATAAYIPIAIARLGGYALMLEGVNRPPFEPAASWDITPAVSIIATPGDRYEVLKIDASGDTVWVFRRPEPPRRVTPREARDSARAFQARLDSIPVPLDRVDRMSDAARSGTLPDVVPPILAVYATHGQIWLRRWPPPDASDRTYFDVINQDGEFLHSVVVPAVLLDTPTPYVSPGFVVGVMRDTATHVQSIAVFNVRER